MSTTLRDVIESAGYDLEILDDAEWLLAQKDIFDELIEEAEATIEEAEAECEHENTHTETVENTADYEYNQAIGNTSYPLQEVEIEICDDCEMQRNLPDGDWENV